MKQIGIIGPEEKNILPELKKIFLSTANEIGMLIAEQGGILITGGCTGVAEAATKGAFEAGGITVGTPGPKRGSAVDGIVVEICTPINVGDYLFAGTLSSDVIIVFPGDAGTLAELAIAYRYRKPLIFIQGISDSLLEKTFWNVDKEYPQFTAKDAYEAVQIAMREAESLIRNRS